MARHITIINESGLYNAILGSKKPQAKAFKKWVTSEVLPSIRKSGSYIRESANAEIIAEHNLLDSCVTMAIFAEETHLLAKVLKKLAQKYEANAKFAESRLKSALKHNPDILKKSKRIARGIEGSKADLRFLLY